MERTHGIGIGLVTAITLLGTMMVVVDLDATAKGSPDRHVPPTLIERPGCDAPPTVNSFEPAGPHGTARGASQVISVVVPETAIIRVNGRGKVLSAMTNTGCRPRRGDDIYIARPGGKLTQAVGTEIVERRWTGDFTRPGVQVSQRGPTQQTEPTLRPASSRRSAEFIMDSRQSVGTKQVGRSARHPNGI
jgi:hypothetical protein